MDNNLDYVVKKHGYSFAENFPSIAAKRIYKARIEKGLSIKKLAKLSKIDRTYLNNIELGKNIPSTNIIKKLSIILKGPIWYLGAYEQLPENTLGKSIYKCRLFLGYSQKEFAKALGALPCTVREWEKDKSKPTNKYMSILNTYLDILRQKTTYI